LNVQICTFGELDIKMEDLRYLFNVESHASMRVKLEGYPVPFC